MNRWFDAGLLFRLLVPLVLVSLLGIAPRQHALVLALRQARRAQEAGSPASAAAAFSTAASYLPWRADLWESAGHSALQAGDHQSAREHFRRADLHGELSSAGYAALGEAAWLAGDLPAAIQAWQAAIRSGSSPIPLYNRLVEAHLLLDDVPAAISDLQALANLQPAEPQVYYRLGLLLASRQPEAALAYFNRASELDPALSSGARAFQRSINAARAAGDPAYTLVASGRHLASLGEWGWAAAAFQQATLSNPGYAEAWAYLGEARQQAAPPSSGGPPATPSSSPGFAELHKALELDPGSLAANTFLALYWQRRAHYDLALVYLHAAAGLEPRNPALQAEIGNTLAVLGDLSRALAYYQRAADLAPRDPLYWRLLAEFTVRYEIEVRQAGLPAARQAVILNPQDPASLDVIAQVYLLLEDPLSAQRFLQRALQADPGYAPARLHLGLLYLLQGETARAREQLTLARSLAPVDTYTGEHARRLLESHFP